MLAGGLRFPCPAAKNTGAENILHCGTSGMMIAGAVTTMAEPCLPRMAKKTENAGDWEGSAVTFKNHAEDCRMPVDTRTPDNKTDVTLSELIFGALLGIGAVACIWVSTTLLIYLYQNI